MSRVLELRTLGVAGIVGIGLLLASGSLYLTAIEPMRDELIRQTREEQRLDQQIQAHLHRSPTTAPQPQTSQPDVAAGTELAPLPSLTEAPVLFDKLYALGERRGMLLERASYNLVNHVKPAVAQYQVTLPLKCGYPELRDFLPDALALAPVSSLDNVSVQRAKASDPLQDVSVTLSYYFAAE